MQLEQLVTNKFRSFRRSDPSKPAEKNKGPVLKPTFAAVTANKSVANNQNNRNPPINNSKLYCHYFNNSGNCLHGNKFKKIHSKAPVCSFHANCNSNACSSTPKKGSFLGMNSAPYFTPPHMSHWPWMFPQMDLNMFHSQWNGPARNNSRGRN